MQKTSFSKKFFRVFLRLIICAVIFLSVVVSSRAQVKYNPRYGNDSTRRIDSVSMIQYDAQINKMQLLDKLLRSDFESIKSRINTSSEVTLKNDIMIMQNKNANINAEITACNNLPPLLIELHRTDYLSALQSWFDDLKFLYNACTTQLQYDINAFQQRQQSKMITDLFTKPSCCSNFLF